MGNHKIVINDVTIINENRIFIGSVVISDGIIESIIDSSDFIADKYNDANIIDASGLYLLPGVIDDQVHFRDPGLTYKADTYTESKAAVAGGVTSFMDMPNTIPNCLTQELLEEKYQHASKVSLANYSYYMGASNDNLDEVVKTDPKSVCGIKVFMGSSTGNMLVDDEHTLAGIFSKAPTLVAVHCEDEATIVKNTKEYLAKYGDDAPTKIHPLIRPAEACYLSSAKAVKLAKENNTRLHVLHLTSAKEMELFSNNIPLEDKMITAEVCIHHLWFSDEDYNRKGNLIKWNPAIKTAHDRNILLASVINNKIDVVATDHAPHTLEEKERVYSKAPSGGPMVQHSLVAMLELYHKGEISLEKIVEKMCHNPAKLFQINNRGFIREGYAADLVLVDMEKPHTVTRESVLYKCGWSPLEGEMMHSEVVSTFVNGHMVYNRGKFDESKKGNRLLFNR